MEHLPQLATFSYPTTETNQFDVELARIEADTYLGLARMNVELAWIQTDAALCSASMNLYADETRNLISSTEAVMSKTLDLYRGNAAPSFMQCRAKTKLGLLGRSCKITVTARIHQTYYLRGPVR